MQTTQFVPFRTKQIREYEDQKCCKARSNITATETVIDPNRADKSLKGTLPTKPQQDSRTDKIKELARHKIAEAEAAIAAAEASALQSLHHQTFAPQRMPLWVLPAAAERGPSTPNRALPASISIEQRKQGAIQGQAAAGSDAFPQRLQQHQTQSGPVKTVSSLAPSLKTQPNTILEEAGMRRKPRSFDAGKSCYAPGHPLHCQAEPQKARAWGASTVTSRQLPPWAKQTELPSFAAVPSGTLLSQGST